MKLILGVNGLVWVGLSGSHESQDTQRAATSTPEQHETIARVANAIRVLAALDLNLMPTRISEVYQVRHASPSRAVNRLAFTLGIALCCDVRRQA